MADYAVVKGTRLRATRVDACGMPIAGPRSRVVTEGFITATFSPVLREAEDLEQANAEGRVCVSDRTPPELKWWGVAIDLCKVDTCLFSMFLDWDVLTDWDGNDVGFGDKKRIPSDRGVAIEIWSGVGSGDQCEVPTTDDILEASAGGLVLPYGYFALPVMKEVQIGEIAIGASVSTFALSGITGYGPRWGKGPYNVVPTDVNNTAGRLPATYITKERQLISLKTTIAPPAAETGCCPLVLPSPYYGETAVEVGPTQPDCDAVGTNERQTVTITGTPTGGSFKLSFLGQETANIAWNAAAAAVDTALELLSTIGVGNVAVTGGPGPGTPYVVEFQGDLAALNLPLMTGTDTLTGGTTPGVTVVETQAGGTY